MEVLLQKSSGLNDVKSCSSRQDNIEMSLHKTQGLEVKFCEDFGKCRDGMTIPYL